MQNQQQLIGCRGLIIFNDKYQEELHIYKFLSIEDYYYF